MSELLKEDEEFLHLYAYVHGNSDEFSDWEMLGDKFLFNDTVQQAEHYALDELKIYYRIRKSDGEVFYDRVSG